MIVKQDHNIHTVQRGEYPLRLKRTRRSASTAVATVALLCFMAGCGTSSTPPQTNPPAATAASTLWLKLQEGK